MVCLLDSDIYNFLGFKSHVSVLIISAAFGSIFSRRVFLVAQTIVEKMKKNGEKLFDCL